MGVSLLYQCVVLYEDWQMQCCGVPFKIGDTVKWIVAKLDSNEIPVDVGTINYYYEAHSSNYKELFILFGVVDEIRALYYKYEELPDSKISIPMDGLTLNVYIAAGGDEPFKNLDFILKTRTLKILALKVLVLKILTTKS
jgi:hypothetical protein